jgi:hypothetical protein
MKYNTLAKENAQHDPQIITGHDPSDYLWRIAVQIHIYADKAAQQTSADGDDGRRNQQGNKRFNGFNHYSSKNESNRFQRPLKIHRSPTFESSGSYNYWYFKSSKKRALKA